MRMLSELATEVTVLSSLGVTWIMVISVGRQIHDDTGVCHLHVDELARELGIPSDLGDLEFIHGRLYSSSLGVIWIMVTLVHCQIRDDTGVCCLQVNELARELGIPCNWGDLENIPG
jgi:hypothetical protein